MKKLIEKIRHVLIVPNTFDPDDLRRRQVLNSVLLFMIIFGCLLMAWNSWGNDFTILVQDLISFNLAGWEGLLINVGAIVLFTILLFLNRSNRMPRNLAGWIVVLSMLALISLGDTPAELIRGRSVFTWAVPVALSVIILPPASVVVVDLVITAVFLYFSGFSWDYFESYTVMEIYIVSFISWLGMSIAERAIRDARNEAKKNAAILEGVAEGVIVLGQNNRIVLTNGVASELLGSAIARIAPTTEDAEIGGRALSFRWSEVEGVGWVAIVRDISRQIEIDHAKDAILRVVSHEMRTPLAAILGFAEVLETRAVPGMATRIRANGQRLLKLVNDLLDMAQIQAGAFAIHAETFSPAILEAYVLENFQKVAEAKGIVLEVHSAPDLPERVSGDVQRLEQVISNLLSNALKFTEKGGRVDVSLCAGAGLGWQIVVKDSGIGIPPERLSDIFEPFRRASDYARRKHQGVGLGLSIASKIVQLSGGNLSVESAVAVGSTFTVRLPVA